MDCWICGLQSVGCSIEVVEGSYLHGCGVTQLDQLRKFLKIIFKLSFGINFLDVLRK
jgi:hypothetical protein